VQPLICYEAVFSEFTDIDAELLINLSNDGGFGSELEARQDLAISALRSVETGRPQLRVANSGTSALIDGSGAVVASLPPGARGVLVGTLHPDAGHRALPGWWLAVLGLLGVAVSRVPRLAMRRA
jgi:apolipoprotein N-acyltransferase